LLRLVWKPVRPLGGVESFWNSESTLELSHSYIILKEQRSVSLGYKMERHLLADIGPIFGCTMHNGYFP
jgi:hypothetical protein